MYSLSLQHHHYPIITPLHVWRTFAFNQLDCKFHMYIFLRRFISLICIVNAFNARTVYGITVSSVSIVFETFNYNASLQAFNGLNTTISSLIETRYVRNNARRRARINRLFSVTKMSMMS